MLLKLWNINHTLGNLVLPSRNYDEDADTCILVFVGFSIFFCTTVGKYFYFL